MRDRANERGLSIVPPCALDACPLRGTAAPPVAADNNRTGYLGPVVKRQAYASCVGALPRDGLAIQQRHTIRFAHLVQQGTAQVPVLDHVAHRAFFDLAMVEMHEERRRAMPGMTVGHLDVQHRLCVPGKPVPQSYAFQQSL